MGPEYQDVELMSFHSVSKGFLGECGKRGGYVELTNVDSDAAEELYKVSAVEMVEIPSFSS